MQGSQLERGEPLRDTARVLSGYCHAIVLRTFGHDRAEEMARYAGVPVINGLTDLLAPVPGAGRSPDRRAALRRRRRRAHAAHDEVRVGGRRQQHGQFVDRGGRHPGPRSGDRLPGRVRTGRGRAVAGARDRARADHDRARAGRRGRGPKRDLHRRVRVDGAGGGSGRAPAGVRRLLHRRRVDARRGARARWSCTACPPTAARRSPTT